jgi:GrpB-like predicted nucleotidyltransferase (UPF0157 family)
VYDPAWPASYDEHRRRITTALGAGARSVENIGSTAVPGLSAKPIIDILVTVPDITDEEVHLPALIGAGYRLRVREPGHRMVRTPDRDVHIHILEPTDPAADDYLLLRDRLRSHEADRELYEETKRELVARHWIDMNAYAEARTSVIEGIKDRARAEGAGRRRGRGPETSDRAPPVHRRSLRRPHQQGDALDVWVIRKTPTVLSVNAILCRQLRSSEETAC